MKDKQELVVPVSTHQYIEGGAPPGKRNEALFAAVCQCRDARWPEATIIDILSRRAMLDGLSQDEAIKTINSALKGPTRPPARRVGGESRPRPRPRSMAIQEKPQEKPQNSAKIRPAVRYMLDENVSLPDKIEKGASTLLSHLFKPSERIQLVVAKIGEDGKEKPIGSHPILPCEQWLERMEKHDGDVGGIFSTYTEEGKVDEGLYFSINPIDDAKKGRKMGNMARMDLALIEFDTISLVQQWQLITLSKIPCAAVTYSGGKSLHALVRVNARTREEYAVRVQQLMDHFSEYDVDTANKDPSRLSRLPGVTRGDTGKEQTLLALDIGYDTWREWEDSQDDSFPDILSMEGLYNEDIQQPPPIIEGLLHRQMSFSLGGSSKTYKSWTLLDMAVSVANGVPFWGMKTFPGKVLLVNFEIQKYFMRERVKQMCAAKKCELPSENLFFWNLRGEAQALEAIRPKFTKAMVNANFSMVILDPIYKTLGDRDENAAGDINSLMNELEAIALETGAAVVFATHFSKGNQSAKRSHDRTSGSGVFARSPDTIITMTEHEKHDCFTVESTLRNHQAPKPFVIEMEFPLFKRRDDLNPQKLQSQETSKSKDADSTVGTVMHLLDPTTWKLQKDLVAELKDDGISETATKRAIQQGISSKKIFREKNPDGRGFRLRRNPSVSLVL